MNERAIFMEALDRDTQTARSAYLDEACGGDTALRQRVEALLASHEQAGSFLGKPVPERLAEGLATPDRSAETQGESPTADGDGEGLDFLTPSDQPGSLGRLWHYEIHEVIGRGGMGIVLRAFDEKLHRVVAIKVMAPNSPANGAARKRFVREARAAAAVRDEHVVGIYAVEEGSATPYLVMEYIAGVSLQERLDRSGPLEVKEILRIGMQAATGLAAAHAQGLIHRDVKPANILLENHVERVKITDFGLARAAADASLTQEGVVAGTPQYMAPEQARGEVLDHRADLFSLGSVLYALCTGRPPFRAENTLAVLKRVCEETPHPIRDVNPDVPEWLVEIIAKLQAKDPSARFQSAQEVAEVLGRELAAMQRGGVEGPLLRPPLAKRPRRRLAVAAGVLLLFVAGLVLTEWMGITHPAAVMLDRFKPNNAAVAKGEDGRNDVQPAELPAPSGPVKPFVIVAGADRGEKSYETLVEAVAQASNGDAIEIRGDGPFVSAPPRFKGALTIRAGAGARPVLRWNGESQCLFSTHYDLVLEGLGFQDDHLRSAENYALVCGESTQSSLYVANCRFQNTDKEGCTGIVSWCPTCVVCNSELLWNGAVLMNYSSREKRLQTLDNNCVGATCSALFMAYSRPGQQSRIRLTHNTLKGGPAVFFSTGDGAVQDVPGIEPVGFEAAENIFDCSILSFGGAAIDKVHSDAAAERLLRRIVKWTGRRNIYGARSIFYMKMTLEEWNRFWETPNAESSQGVVDLSGWRAYPERMKDRPNDVTAADFRLTANSAGAGAGEGGRDLGADVDLVGPGPAYEHWKKTPAYQQWLKDTGQSK